jgi:hypothetical protein
MTVEPTVAFPDGRYVRGFEADIDIVDPRTIFVRGRMRDHRLDLEHTWLLATPAYEVLEAGAVQHGGRREELAPELCARYPAIRGVTIGRGFSRRILDAFGEDLPGRQEHLLLAIEMARVGQQIYQVPAGFDARFRRDAQVRSAEAMVSWEKDRAYMEGLAESCYTYRDASRPLFSSRRIVSIVGPEITSPAPGTRRAFWRRKRLAIRRAYGQGTAFLCESAMEDPLHDIAIGFRLSADGTVSEAHSRAPRVPYSGLCEDPHRRTASLNGLRLTRDFVRELADHVGGAQGCTHLFDLSVDCLRLFEELA